MSDPQLDELYLTDQQLLNYLEKKEINPTDLFNLADKRERLLEVILQRVKQQPALAQIPQWQDALTRTQHIVEMMQRKTEQIGQLLHKYQYSSKSLQQYKKFL